MPEIVVFRLDMGGDEPPTAPETVAPDTVAPTPALGTE